jgi:hypothetical protein
VNSARLSINATTTTIALDGPDLTLEEILTAHLELGHGSLNGASPIAPSPKPRIVAVHALRRQGTADAAVHAMAPAMTTGSYANVTAARTTMMRIEGNLAGIFRVATPQLPSVSSLQALTI